VTTTATQAASAIRRRNEATFRCPVPGCGSTFTRRFNLKGQCSSAFRVQHRNSRTHAQVICALTPLNDHMPASGPGATRHLRVSTIVSGTISSTRPKRARTCARAVANHFLAQTHLIDIVSSPAFALHGVVLNIFPTVRSEGGVDCRTHIQALGGSLSSLSVSPHGEDSGSPGDTTDGSHGTPGASGTSGRSRPPSV
jgi:hypothetical protein